MNEKTYWVTVPFAGYILIKINADSEKTAIDKALQADVYIDLLGDDSDVVELEEFELYRRIVQGNIVYPSVWEAEARDAS